MSDSENLIKVICSCLENLKDRKIVIWGACKSGELLKSLLEENNVCIDFFVDKKAEHLDCKKSLIISPDILKGNNNNFFVIIGVSNYYDDIEKFLHENNYKDIRGNEVVGSLENTTVQFGGYNNKIIVNNKLLLKTNLNIRFLSNNSSLTVGNNCSFNKDMNIIIQEKSSLIIGDNCMFGNNSYVVVAIDSTIDIGKNSTFGDMLVMFSTFSGTVKIGEDCMASSNVTVGNNDGHVIFDVNKEIQINVKDSIIIGNHVWLGNKCTVLSGAKIGDGSIVASNGVVTKKFPNNCIVAGVPSKIIRKDIAWDRSITNATLVKDSLYWKRTEFRT